MPNKGPASMTLEELQVLDQELRQAGYEIEAEIAKVMQPLRKKRRDLRRLRDQVAVAIDAQREIARMPEHQREVLRQILEAEVTEPAPAPSTEEDATDG